MKSSSLEANIGVGKFCLSSLVISSFLDGANANNKIPITKKSKLNIKKIFENKKLFIYYFLILNKMSNQLANISSCNSCNSWGSPGNDGSDSIGWSVCTANNGQFIPSPEYSGGDGFLTIGSLQSAISKGSEYPNLGNCTNVQDPQLGSYYQPCEQCYTDGANWKPSQQKENFQTGFGSYWARPTCYLNMGQTWSVQKPYTL